MTSKTISPNMTALAAALGCEPDFVSNRCRFLELVVVNCGRCGGGGRYSFNMMDGDRCYGCNGIGVVMPKTITAAHVAEVTEAVAAGKLAPYLQNLRNRKIAARADKQIFAVWGATRVNAANCHIYGAVETHARNAQMHALADAALEVSRYIRNDTDAPIAVVSAFVAELPITLAAIEALDFTESEGIAALAVMAEKKAAWKARIAEEKATRGY